MSGSTRTAPHQARVTRVIPQEDAARIELEFADGRVYASASLPAPRVGDSVRLRIEGGARFPVS